MDEVFEIGSVVEGIVNHVTPFGAFVDLPVAPHMQALLHVSEITDRRDQFILADHFLEKGDSRLFRIIDISPEIGRVSLSLREVGQKSP